MPSDNTPNRQARHLAQRAIIALSGIVLAGISVALLHFVNPDLDPFTRAMSDYAHGHFGTLMVAALIGLAVSLLSLADAFCQIATSPLQRTGVILLRMAGICTLLAGVFPADNTPDGSFNTPSGAIHAVASFLLSPLIVGAMPCLSARLNQESGNQTIQQFAQVLAILNFAAFVFLLAINLVTHLPFGGFGQRVFMGLICSWLLLSIVRISLMAKPKNILK